MDPNETVCFCNDVTRGMIKDAIAAGAKTLEDVQEATGAGTACGGCLDDIQAIIDELAEYFIFDRAPMELPLIPWGTYLPETAKRRI